MRTLTFAAAAALLSGARASDAEPAITQALVDEINAKQKSWVAHFSPRFATATVGDIKGLCGTVLKSDPAFHDEGLEEKAEDSLWSKDIPSDFDVRTQWPKCANVTGHVRDQSACGSCWAFGSTEALNDRRCIATGDTALLSVEDTVSNCGILHCFSMGCNGGQPGAAWGWFQRTGVVTGGDYSDIGKGDTCAPYAFQPCAHHVDPTPQYPKCPSGDYPTPRIGSACSESKYSKSYSSDKKKAASSYSLSSVEKIQQDIMQYGSVSAAFTVYSDFPAYKSGVYSHTSGSPLGGHAIKILGWGTESGADFWLVANSWNDQWGDHGLFKIARGKNECGIESQVSAGTAASDTATVVV